MIRIFNYPLSETLVMEEMLARKESGLSHVLKTYHTCVIMMFLDFLLIYFLKIFHGICEFLDPIVRPTIITKHT
jgi:hypothetical protein